MKHLRRLSLLLAFALITAFSSFFAYADETSADPIKDFAITSGNAASVYCIDNGQFLYTQRGDDVTEPSVSAKLVACMVAADILKNRGLRLDETMVDINQSAISYINNVYNGDITDRIFIDFRMPVMGLEAGSSYTARDIISSVLVAGANDATAALADDFGTKYLDGDINSFVDKMNEKVASLGLTKTHFKNPMGLTENGQTTTPNEVALIAAAFYGYNELVTLADVEQFTFGGRTTVRNKNFLKNDYFITGYKAPNAIGLTAGQPNADGNYCLITASQQTEGLTYIFVVMEANGIRVENTEAGAKYSLYDKHAYSDMWELIGWARESFVYYTVADADLPIDELRVKYGSPSDHLMVYPKEDINKLIPKSETITLHHDPIAYNEEIVYFEEFNGSQSPTANAPVKAETVVGRVKYYYTDAQGNRVDIAEIDAVVKETAEENTGLKVLDDAGNLLTNVIMRTVLIILVSVIGIYIVVSIVMAILRNTKKSKPKKPTNKKTPAKKKGKSAQKPKSSSASKDNTATREYD